MLKTNNSLFFYIINTFFLQFSEQHNVYNEYNQWPIKKFNVLITINFT